MWFDPRTERPRLYTLGSREQIPGAGVASSDEEDDLFDRVVQDPSETLIEVDVLGVHDFRHWWWSYGR